MVKIIGISGSVNHPSRTASLVGEILDQLGQDPAFETRLIELSEEAPVLFSALRREDLHGRSAQIVESVEQADLLVVGTPVYRASYTGALKHLFDLVHHRYFIGKPVILAATGGTPLHGLVTEHQLRPLFGFLNALSLPTAIYAVEQDFSEYRLNNTVVSQRIERVVAEARTQIALLLELHGHVRPLVSAV
ncbi:FMN reductase [Acidisoma silvae]|uniref:FMN reductase n=1 Tax=Acidisoma silvae TaxID=2802396 RepID=A0A964E1H9_9PROT|nr:FMN reductase [Acidisoma silvae]MCB8877788.1 FMN reductase [Acidisoma silvae]